jgi:hypothetical protein
VRAVREGWFPEIAAPDVPSETLYGTCEEIKRNTSNATEIIHSYPWGDPAYWRGPLVNQSDTIKAPHETPQHIRPEHYNDFSGVVSQLMFIAGAFLLFFGIREYNAHRTRKGYTEF